MLVQFDNVLNLKGEWTLTTNIASVGKDRKTSKRSDYSFLSFCFAMSLNGSEEGRKTNTLCEARKKSKKGKSRVVSKLAWENGSA